MVQSRSEHERIDLPPMSSKQCHQIIELFLVAYTWKQEESNIFVIIYLNTTNNKRKGLVKLDFLQVWSQKTHIEFYFKLTILDLFIVSMET